MGIAARRMVGSLTLVALVATGACSTSEGDDRADGGDTTSSTTAVTDRTDGVDVEDADDSPVAPGVADAIGKATTTAVPTTVEPSGLVEGDDESGEDVDRDAVADDGTGATDLTDGTAVRRQAVVATPAPTTPTTAVPPPATTPTTGAPPAPTTTAGWVAVSCTPLAPPPGWAPSSSWVPGPTC